MMRSRPLAARVWTWVALAAAGVCATFACPAGELVANGAFEVNNGPAMRGFPGWTVYTQSGSNPDGGFYAQTGSLGPLTPFSVPTPPQGSFAAMSDQNGVGSYALYQDVALPAGSHPMLTARIYVQNEAEDFQAPATLDYTTIPNQQARFDIVSPAAAPMDVGAGVLQTLYASQSGDAPMSGYQTITADLSAYAGTTVRLRFAEADNLEGLLFGVDAVSIKVNTSIVTTASLTGTNNPSVYGQAVVLTAIVTGQSPTGTVIFADAGVPIACGSTNLSPVDSTHSRATCTTSALSVGTHSLITAVYGGNAVNLTSTSPAYTQVVNPAATTTTITPPIAVAPGQTTLIHVTVAIVAPGSAALIGTVTINDTTDSLSCSYSLPATGCSITPTTTGTKTLTATFTPDPSIAASVTGSSGNGQLLVTTATVSVSVSTSLSPSTYGNSVTFTAVVTGQTPTGSVSFSDGATVFCAAAPVTGGGNSPSATCTTNAVPTGTQVITASYSGDPGNVAASGTVNQVVNQATSVVTLTDSPQPGIFGQPIVFTATIAGVSPTGTVTFSDGATPLGTVTVGATGQAVFSTSTLTTGAHTITAAYSGDTNYTPGSATLSITVIVPVIVSAPAVTGWMLMLLALAMALGARSFGFRRQRQD